MPPYVSWFTGRHGENAHRALFLAWCVVTIAAAAHHEPWRDEADNWLVARDRSLVEMWHLMKHVGQPWLWYLVEVPFAKGGAGYHWQQIIHWPIAAAAAAVVIFRSPFSLLTRTLIVASYFLVYEYSVIARGYSLTVLFLFLACSFAGPRRAPSFGLGASLGLLANATSIGLFFACAFQLWALVELVILLARRRAALTFQRVLATLLGWAGTWIALLQLFPRPLHGQKPEASASVDALLLALREGVMPFGGDELRLAGAVLWFAATLWLIRSSWFAAAFFLTSTGLFSYLFYAVHAGYVRHWGFIVIAAVAARWLALVERDLDERAALRASRRPAAHLAAFVLTSIVLALWCARGAEQVIQEIRMPFSNAKDMAMFIRSQKLQKRIIAAHKAEAAVAVLPWLPRTKLWYPELRRYGTHMPWDREMRVGRAVRQPAALGRVKRTFSRWRDEKRGVLLLTSTPLRQPAQEGYVLLHASAAPLCSTHGENFWLYAPLRPKKAPR